MIDPQQASAIAVANRRARAAVKRELESGVRSPVDVVRTAWHDRASVEAGLRVVELLGSLSGVGESKLAKVLLETGISPRKRVGYLGVRQQRALEVWLLERATRNGRSNRTGRLIVVAGPTAVGKGTVVSRVREMFPAAQFSVSATTRTPRPGEIDGVHYYFVSPHQFDVLVDTDQMLEWAVVHGEHRYGTPRQPIDDALNSGHSIIVEIDIQGARQVKKAMPSAVLVFLLPPSWDELVRRLTARGTESLEEQQRRLETAKAEIDAQSDFDITIVNDDVDAAAKAVIELLTES